jgi:CHAT domain-containing protein
MKKLFSLLVLVFSVSLAFTQGDYKQYMDLSYAEIDSLMYVEYRKGAFDQAILLMQAARGKAEKEFGTEDSTFAQYTNDLAFFYVQTAQYSKALPLLIQAKNIKEKALMTEDPSFATSLNNLAYLYERIGEYEKALPLHLEAKSIREKVLGKKHPEYMSSLNNLANLHKKMGDYEKALPLYIQLKNISEKVFGKEHAEFARALNNLAVLYYKMKAYDKALPLYIQAKETNAKILGEEHPNFAGSLNNVAIVYKDMGDFAAALPLLLQAKDIYKKRFGKDHPIYATSVGNLAALYEKMGAYEKALPLYIKAKEIDAKVLGKDHPSFALSLNNLANLYISVEDYNKAWETLGEAIGSQSGLSLRQDFSVEKLDSLLKIAYPSDSHIKQILRSLSSVYLIIEKNDEIKNKAAKQIFIVDLATALLTKRRQQLSNEKDKLRMLTESNAWLRKSLEVLDSEQDRQRAFQLSDENKSVLLYQATKSEAAYRLGALPDSLVSQNKKLLKEQSQLQAKLLEKRPETEKDSLRSELIDVNQDIDAFIEMIRKKYPKYHKLKYQEVDANVEEIQALLDEKTALIEYVIADSAVHIFRVDKKEVLWHQEAIVDSVLIDKVEQLHQSLSDYSQIAKEKEENFASYTELAHWFYQKMLAPVLNEDEIENLIIVTDGELGHLPFESFLVEKVADKSNYKDLHYLLQDYNISYNYSATLWKDNKTAKQQDNNGQLLAMAARYPKSIDSILVRGRLPTTRWMRDALSPLPAARAEVEALSREFNGYFAFDSLASERVLYEKAADYAIIHLAMHGLLDEKRPILSSLALTEDGDSLYDNFWQAHEISKMELNADLVVLSACETGYGRFETGNGIASLARAFMYAGVPSLVVSLWQVNDQSTSIIMQNFYKHLASGETKSAALRQAKLDYISISDDIAAHPAFWSPFILIGDEAPVKIQRKGAGNWLWWGIGAGALLLVGIGFGLAGRKKAA